MKKLMILVVSALLLFGCEGGSRADSAPGSSVAYESAATESEGGAVQSLLKDRIIIRNASLTVRVKEADKAEHEAKQIVTSSGGYVESSHTQGLGTSSPSLSLAIRVPVQKFEAALEKLAKLGTVLEKSQGTEDVTEQVVDLEARMKTLTVQEETYRNLLARTSKMEDIIKLEDRLAEIRVEIERLDAQRKGFRDQAQYSTISLFLTQESTTKVGPTDEGWAGEAWGTSKGQLGELIRLAASLGIWLFVMSPLWLPGLVLLWWLAKRKPKAR